MERAFSPTGGSSGEGCARLLLCQETPNVSQPIGAEPRPVTLGGSPETRVNPEHPGWNDISPRKQVGPDRAALERGVDAYLPLVRRVVRQVARRLPSNVQRDNLLAAGVFGLVDSLRRNGGDGGDAFEWYARTRIRGAIVDELRAQDWLSRRARAAGGVATCFISFDEVGNADECGLAGSDNPSEALESSSLRRALARALEQIPDRERHVVARHYFEGAKLKELGAELGVSEPRIPQILARAIERLRAILVVEAA